MLEVSTAEAREGFGSVTLGDVSSLANWKSFDDQVEIKFNTADLLAARMRDLEHYRSSSRQVAVQLPGERVFNCIAMGFERVGDVATFYLRKSGKC